MLQRKSMQLNDMKNKSPQHHREFLCDQRCKESCTFNICLNLGFNRNERIIMLPLDP